MIRVLLVDDHELLRAGLRSRLEREPGIAIVGEADTAEGAVLMARKLQPDRSSWTSCCRGRAVPT